MHSQLIFYRCPGTLLLVVKQTLHHAFLTKLAGFLTIAHSEAPLKWDYLSNFYFNLLILFPLLFHLQSPLLAWSLSLALNLLFITVNSKQETVLWIYNCGLCSLAQSTICFLRSSANHQIHPFSCPLSLLGLSDFLGVLKSYRPDWISLASPKIGDTDFPSLVTAASSRPLRYDE